MTNRMYNDLIKCLKRKNKILKFTAVFIAVLLSLIIILLSHKCKICISEAENAKKLIPESETQVALKC